MRLLLWIVLLIVPLAGPAQAAQAAKAVVFPLSEVRRGLVGQGVTVFAEGSLTPFRVEVLGVLKDFIGPGQDLILARLHGAEIEHTGVISGMSGSPVYVQGKLLGAVSYRLGAFSKEPIAGITPAAYMIAAAEDARAARLAEANLGDENPIFNKLATAQNDPVDRPLQEMARSLQPIDSPIFIAGAAPGLIDHYAQRLAGQGLTVLRGGGDGAAMAGQAGGKNSPRVVAQVQKKSRPPVQAKTLFVPGGPMAGVLVAGDLSMAATGTVTIVDEDRVIGFGHPFLGRGTTAMPLAQAEIVTTLASLSGSFKISALGDRVGQFVQDRSTAVVAVVGQRAPVVDVDVRLDGTAQGLRKDEKKRYHFEVAKDPALTPLLTEIAIASAVGGRIGFDTGGSAKLTLRIKIPGQAELLLQDLISVADYGSVATGVAGYIGDQLTKLWTNPFQEIPEMAISVELSLFDQPQQRGIVALSASPQRLCPGQELRVAVDSINYRGQRLRMVHRLLVPKDVAPGPLDLDVGGIKQLKDVDKQSGRFAVATNLAGLIEQLTQQRRADHLFWVLSRAEKNPRIGGQVLRHLPVSMTSLLAAGGDGPLLSGTSRWVVEEKVLDSGFVVSGGGRVSLEILDEECAQ